MRAVDVRTGQVLLSVATSKKVLSKEVRAGFFRYVSYKRLLEAEAGYSDNEPMHICVSQAIEKAEAECGAPLKISGFQRFALGEGLEKNSNDFASEVAATINN